MTTRSTDDSRITDETATGLGSWPGTPGGANRKPGHVGDDPARNDAIAYSSNDSVNAIRNADNSAGYSSGNVTRQNVCHELAPRSWPASSSEMLSRSNNGVIVRIVYGNATTTCPITTACSPRPM